MTRIELEHEGKKYFKSNGKWYSRLGERQPEMDAVLDRKLSILEDAKLWVGEVDGEIFVFDSEVPPSDNAVTFWSVSKDRFADLNRAHARAAARILEGEDRKIAIEKYRKSVVVRHRLRFHRMGKKYIGIRESSRQVPRDTHCWSCSRSITSDGYPECIECGWILCECGACGCGKR